MSSRFPTPEDKHLLARVFCPHGHSFVVYDTCPATQVETAPPDQKIGWRERRAFRKLVREMES